MPHALYPLLATLVGALGKPNDPNYSLRPLLDGLVRHFDASGGMILRADDPTAMRLSALVGDILDDEDLSPALMDVTYHALFRRWEPALVPAGFDGYPNAILGAPLKAGERGIGGVFLLRPSDRPPFTPADRDALEMVGLAVGSLIDMQDLARRTGARRAELEAVHAAMVDGLVVVDRRGYIQAFNEAFKRLSKVPPYALYGHRWDQLLVPRPHPSVDTKAALAAFHDALIEGVDRLNNTGCPAYLCQPDGTQVPVMMGMATIEEGERVTGGVLSVRDATTEAELERQKDDFIATVSHELKTPLTTIGGFVELLHNHPLPRAEQVPLFELIMDESARLGRMITELLDLSKIQSGNLSLHLERFGVAKLLRQVVHPFQVRHQATHQFELAISPPRGSMVADRDRVVQVLVNLVGNAVKYSPQGGRVGIQATKDGDDWLIAVADTGIGIPEHALDRLFTRFYRVNEQQSTGSGLGLFITKNLVERHGGQISVTSREGQGATFTVRLPCVTRR